MGNSMESRFQKINEKIGVLHLKVDEALGAFKELKGEARILKLVSIGIFVEIFLASLKIIFGKG